jgi:hypothetical protein
MRPTPKRIRELVEYDQATGLFRFRRPITRRPSSWYEGSKSVRDYRRMYIDGHNYMAHQIAFVIMCSRWPTREIDHINGIESDNRWRNLRLVTRGQQTMNRKMSKHNTTGAAGVSRFLTKNCELRFRATIAVNRHVFSLGLFDTVAAASRARKAAERRYYGEFARV